MNMTIAKTGIALTAALLGSAALAGENVAQANISAIYQPVVPVSVEGAAPAGGVSLLEGKVQEWLDPSASRVESVEAQADERVAKVGETQDSNVAKENIRGIYTAYSAN